VLLVTSELELRSAADGTVLTLRRTDAASTPPDAFTASAIGPGFSVAAPVYGYLSPSLPEFMRSLGDTPKAGSRKLVWGTLEEELTLAATLDVQGHIYVEFRLRSPDIGSDRWWAFEGRLVLELGAIPKLCRCADRFWGNST